MRKKEFISVLVITLVVVVVWVISDLIHTHSASQNLPDVKAYLDPVDPSFDQQTLSKINNLSTPAPAPTAGPLFTPGPSASPSPIPLFTPAPLPTASPIASASASPR